MIQKTFYLRKGNDFMVTFEGIKKMEKTVEDIKDIANMQLTAMDVIDSPMNAVMAKICFDFVESYIQLEKDKKELLERMNEKLEKIDDVSKEIEQLRRELNYIKKES